MNYKKILLPFALSGIMLATPTWAEDDLNDALQGFEESSPSSELDSAIQGFDTTEAFAEKSADIATEKNTWFSLSGNAGLSIHYNTAQSAPESGQADYRDLSRLRLSATLVADFDLPKNWKGKLELKTFYDPVYSIKGRSDYSQDVLNTYESEARINEAWIAGSLTDNIDLKIGRQIEVWGKSDNIRITDVINPLDNRIPALVDIEDLRLPIFISKLSYYFDQWAVKVMAIQEQRNPLEPAINSDFLPIAAAFKLPSGFNFPDVGEGSIDLSNSSLAMAIDGRFNGWDLSFYRAQVTDSRWHFNSNKSERIYGQIDMTGLAANMIVKGFLLKTEIALLENLQYNTTTNSKSRIDSLIGVEYMGISDWVLSAEYANRSIQDYEVQMINKVDFVHQETPQIALRASYSFDHDNASITLLSSLIGDNNGEQGGFYRLWLDYAINDNLQTTIGYIDYQGGTNPFWNAIANNDRLFFDAKYHF